MLLLLFACATSTPAPVANPTPNVTTPTPAPEAAGPDGPSDIAVPEVTALSTASADIQSGHEVWEARGCGGCHKFGAKLVGPDLAGVTTRRTLPWIERMITDPEAMTKRDPAAKELFRSIMVQMPKQGVTSEELPQLLAYIHAQGG